MSKDEHKEYLRDIQKNLHEYENDIEKLISEIESIVQKYHPFDLLANLMLFTSIRDIETYKEYEDDSSPAFIEYLALLLLTKPFDYYDERSVHPINGNVIVDIHKKIQTLFVKQLFYLAFKDLKPDKEKQDILSELRFRTLARSLFVRSPAYPHHLTELIIDIFEPLSMELRQGLGFDIHDYLIVVEGIKNVVSRKFVERRSEAVKSVAGLSRAVKRYRRKKRTTKDFPLDVLKELAQMRPRDARKAIENWATAWLFLGVGDTMSFSVDDIVEQTGVDQERVQSILDKFSIRFGEVDTKYYRRPAPTHPLTTKPIISLRNQYFCPVPESLLWGVRQAIEGMINPDSPDVVDASIWKRYEKHRASLVERKALEYLEQALGHAKVYKNLKYHVTEQEIKKEGELDGLILLDNVLFLVEVKAGSLSLPARRGSPSRMFRDLSNLVDEAFRQAARAKQYILDADSPVFALPNGKQLRVAKNDIRNIGSGKK